MKAKMFATILCFMVINGIALGESVKEIHICTPVWEYYTQKDGEGLYHELWREIYGKKGIVIKNSYTPYKRCETTFTQKGSNNYDAYPGGYGKEGIASKWHMGTDLLTVTYKKGTVVKWEGEKTFANRKVAWERGYDFDKHGLVTVKVKLTEFNKLKSALQMLEKGRIEFILDYNTAISKYVKELGFENKLVIQADVIAGPKYYMIYARNQKGKALADIWDKGMSRLSKSGKLKEMYRKFEDATFD